MNNFFKRLNEVPRGILAVGVTTLLVAISTTAAFSITPFFLKDTLGIGIVTIGFVESLTESLSQIARLISGIVSDKLKRCKPMFFLGTVFSAIAKPLLIISNGVFLVSVSKICDRLGNGLSAVPRDSYVALHSTPKTKGAYIGLTMTFKTIGCVCGPFIVMAFIYVFKEVNFRYLLCLTAIPALVSIFVCQRYMVDNGYGAQVSKSNFKLSDLAHLSAKFWIFIAIMFIFMLGRAPESYLLLNLRDSNLPEWFCAGAIGFFNLVSVFISYPAGQLADKYGCTRILLWSFVALVAATLCFASHSCIGGVLGVAFWGIQRASSQIISVSCIAGLVDKRLIGSAIGLMNIFIGLSNILAGYISGKIAECYQISYSYFVSFAFAALASLLLICFIKKFDRGTAK